MGPILYHQQWSGTDDPTEAELALDEVVNLNKTTAPQDFSQYANNNGIWGTGGTNPNGNAVVPSGTAHINGKLYAGANVLNFDGHVAWRAYSLKETAVPMGNPIGATGDTVYYWVPSPQ